MIKLGYDGVIVKAREMVNYNPPDNVLFFQNEKQLQMYFSKDIIHLIDDYYHFKDIIDVLKYQSECKNESDFDEYLEVLYSEHEYCPIYKFNLLN